MPKYRVYLARIDSYSVDVEAETEVDAIEQAFESPDLRLAQSWQIDLGEWQLPSDLFPKHHSPDDDVEELT